MNKSGNISIKTRVKRPKKIYGTDLLRTIIDSGYTVNIYTTSKGSYYSPANRNAFHPQKKNKYIWGKGSGGNIYIDSKQAKKKDPLFIIIAHELGHSYREFWEYCFQLTCGVKHIDVIWKKYLM